MRVVYPECRQFPFDETCEQIVRELEKRNWHVPGLIIEFHEYGGNEREKLVEVWCIEGQDLLLRFGRVQSQVPGSAAAASTIVIPKKELHVQAEECGATLDLYVGNKWERDRASFINESHVNSKLKGKRRTYLRYEEKCYCKEDSERTYSSNEIWSLMRDEIATPHRHKGIRSPLLVHTDDCGREYNPRRGRWNWRRWNREPDEPKFFRTAEVMEEFKRYLETTVLAQITRHPILGK
jgi:hypothetical protein